MSWRLLIKSKNKTLLILLTPTRSQASTGSINPMSYLSLKFQSYLICLCIKLIGVVVTPRMHVVGLIYPIFDNSLIIIMIGSNALLSAIVSLEVECFGHSRDLK